MTKRRDAKVEKYRGGIPFTYGPLAYLLKNRIYIAEIHHGGKWFKGEHSAILDRATFERVQEQLKSNAVKRRMAFSESGALLQGKLFDDRGNRMGPTHSRKNGVRYRFYASTALRGRKHKAGSVTRISAPEIEGIVENALRRLRPNLETSGGTISRHLERVIVKENCIELLFPPKGLSKRPIKIPWSKASPNRANNTGASPIGMPDQKLLNAIVRARVWLTALSDGQYASIDELACAADLHPKVVRQGLRLAFLAPVVMSTVLAGEPPMQLKQIPKLLPLSWRAQEQLGG